MTPKEIAEKYAGKKVLINRSAAPYIRHVPNDAEHEWISAVVVGYQGMYVVVSFVDSEYECRSWSIKTKTKDDIVILYPFADRAWYVEPAFINFIPEKKYILTPYPHKCNICKSKARKIGQNIMCSNLKCKSHKNLLKTMRSWQKTINKDGSKEHPIVLKCPRCNNEKEYGLMIYSNKTDFGTECGIHCNRHGKTKYGFQVEKYYEIDTDINIIVQFLGEKSEDIWRFL